ncbi:MAG: VOC family protein [bacterium]
MSHAYHVTNAVSDITEGKTFYRAMFEQLGWKLKHEDKQSLAFTDGKFDFWVVPAEEKISTQPNGTGFNHLALRVDKKEDVDRFYDWLMEVGANIDIKPQAYPHYSENYYAVFFFDGDGTRLEVVFL